MNVHEYIEEKQETPIVDIGKGDETLQNLIIIKQFGRKDTMAIANFYKRFKEKNVGAANNSC